MRKFATGSPTRRDVVRGIGVAGLGAAASAPLGRRAFAQTKKPVNISFWTFDNPQQRPWVHKRVRVELARSTPRLGLSSRQTIPKVVVRGVQ
jgi:hypothetical protein